MRLSVVTAGLALALAACTTTHGSKPLAAASDGSVSAAPGRRASMVASATAMIGQPYRYGGAAPGGFDCSGLVVYAAAAAGIRVPRTANEQLRTGAPVPRAGMQAGDLVFMRIARKELHVGILIDGGRFVHAPAAGRSVRIDSLSAPPYARAFLAARRIADDAPDPAR